MTDTSEDSLGEIWDDPHLHDFDFCSQALSVLGAEVRLAEEWVTDAEGRRGPQKILNKLSQVHLPFNAQEWHELVQNEGNYYIGGCCGSSSALQDKVCHLYRFEAGWCDSRDLSEIAERSISHDGKESYFFAFPGMFDSLKTMETISASPKLAQAMDAKEPWNTMACVYHLTRHHFVPKGREYGAARDHVSPVRKALHIVEQGLSMVALEHLFDRDKPADAQKKVNVSALLWKLHPSLKFLYENIDKLGFGPVEGFAVIERAAGSDGIANNRLGLAIFETKERADEIISQSGDPSEFTTRPVRVSREDGIVFTDTNTQYSFESKTPPKED